MRGKTAKRPDHEIAYRRLREMILFGELAPGQAVTIQGLVEALGVGMTPVREAIRRLTSEGALVFQGNRRVSVPALDAGAWDEIAFVRQVVEPELARLAVENMGPEDIIRLMVIDDQLNAAIDRGDVRGYLEHNYRFHRGLYKLAGAPLWLRGGPGLRVVLGRSGTTSFPDKHAEAMAGMRAGQPEVVAQAIRSDIQQGIDTVRAHLLGEKV